MLQSVIGPQHLDELVDAARAAPPGDFVEVGVYRGGSAERLAVVARETGRRLYLFDTFTGMPFRDPVDHHNVGDFADTSIDMVREAIPEATFCVGVFPDTMPDDIGPIALAHVDCDQYRSVRDCCTHLAPRMAPGGVMVFDDPGVLDGAAQAVRDSFPPDRIKTSAGGKWRVTF